MGIGTARMAHLALPNSRLTVGVSFNSDREIVDAARRDDTYVLFPGPGAIPVEQVPSDRPIELIVVDGTWSQAKKLLRTNPIFDRLPRLGFQPRRPSAYVIRKEPAEGYVSTIEALAEVLRVLEPDGERFERLLDAFHAMVARQQWFQAEVGVSRHRSALRRQRVSPRAALAAQLAAEGPRLVCIHGEANAWPHGSPDRHEPELVHWLAHRPATSETFEQVIAPRSPLGPETCRHIELHEDELRAGATLASCRDEWSRFLRPDDVLVLWGTFYRDLAAREGLAMPEAAIELRDGAARIFKRKMGVLDRCSAIVGSSPAPLGLRGRGGRRLAALAGALARLQDKDEGQFVAQSPEPATRSPAFPVPYEPGPADSPIEPR